MKTKLLYLTFLGFLLGTQEGIASPFRTLDYEDVRKEGGFRAPTLANVTHITHAGQALTTQEQQDLATNTNLTKLRSLDLSHQNIDDNFIGLLCQNVSLCRIINLDLSRNPRLTGASLDSLLESDILGSVRDLPQISGRFGCPSTTIYVQAKETGITATSPGERYFTKHKFHFDITYRNPVTEDPSATPATGVKFIEVTL